MAASCVRLTVSASGGGPWGFRLYGGEDEPLVVAKLRKRSKAHDAGLQEGDCILGINGYSCRGISHGTAMALVEGTNDISLEILRGPVLPDVVNAAFQELGSQLRPVPASALSSSGAAPSQAPAASFSGQQTTSSGRFQQPSPFDSQNQIVNGYPGSSVPTPAKFERREQTYKEGDTTTRVTTETSEQRLGGTTITKVKRETVSQSYGAGGAQQPPMFKVHNVGAPAGQPKASSWAPSGAGGGVSISAPDNVHVQHNPDQSITMTIGFGDGAPEQDQARPPLFKVSKFDSSGSSAKKLPWDQQQQQQQDQAPVHPAYAPRPTDPADELTLLPDEQAEYEAKLQALQKPHPVQLQRILAESGVSSDHESTGSDSPTYLARHRMDSFELDSDEDDFFAQKKKIFADSAFYDDPDHRYPTIDEQVKMARKVAMSLLAPANKKARGHRMFMRRMVKSQKWTADEETQEKDFDVNEGHEEEKYYRPEPWTAPQDEAAPPQAPKWVPPKPADGPPVIPVAPPIPANLFKPQLPFNGAKIKKDDDKAKALSAEEFEKMRLFESKTDHTQVSPAMCFSLANDLRNMKGKGGKLFAKRVARSEKWDADSQETADKINKPNQDLIAKIAMQAAAAGATHNPLAEAAAPPPAASHTGGGAPVNRLKDMIDPPKPKMTPWDAAAEFGTCEEAFSHLKGYNPYGRSQQGQIADNLDMAAAKAASGGSKPAPMSGLPTSGQPAKLPSDYSRKAKHWGSSGHDTESAASGAPFSSSSSTSSSFMDNSAPPPATKGFRPVSFKAPGGAHTGNFQPSGSATASYGSGASYGGGGGGDLGFCDL